MSSKILASCEAAAMLGVSTATLYNYVKREELPPAQPHGWPESIIRAFLDGKRVAVARHEVLQSISRDPPSPRSPGRALYRAIFGEDLTGSPDDFQAVAHSIVGELSFREEAVIRLRYGLLAPTGRFAGLSLEQSAAVFGDVSRERIRQLECKALRKLRQPSRSIPLRNSASNEGPDNA